MKTSASPIQFSGNLNEELLEIISKNSSDNVFIQDKDLRYLTVLNPQLGHGEIEIIGKTDFDIINKEDADKLYQIKRRVLETGESISVDLPLTSKSGEKEFFSGTYFPQSDQEGHINGLIGYFRNLTESIRKDNELNLFFELVTDLIVIASRSGYFIKLNKTWERVLGYTLDELKAIPYAELIHPEDIEPTRREVERQISGSSTLNFTNRYRCKDGSYKWLEWVALPSPDGENLYATARDITQKLAAEARLQESEAKFRKAFYTNPDAITVNKLSDGRYISVNSGFKNIFGYTEEEVIGKTSLEIGMWPNPSERNIFVKALASNGLVENYEARLRTKSGRTIDCLISSTIIELEGIDHILTTTKDISALKQVHARLRESDGRFKKIYDDGPFGMVMFDKELKVLMANSTYCKMLGYSEEELQQLKISDITVTTDYHPEELDLQKITSGESANYRSEKQYLRKDKQLIWVAISVSPNFDDDGNFLYNLAIVEEITHRKQTEKALQNVYERLNLATDAAGVGIWDWDMVTNELIWDQQMYTLYGIANKEQKGGYETWLNGIHPEDQQAQNELMLLCTSGDTPYETEFRVLWPDGSLHWLKSSGQVFRDRNRQPIRMVGINYDITGKKKDEEKIKDQNRRLNTIISTIPDLIFIIDKNGQYLEVITSEPEKLLIPIDKIIGSNINEAFEPELAKIFLAKIREVIEKGEISSIKYIISLKDSASTHFEARIAPMDADKVMILSRDITREEKKEVEINKLSAAVDQSPVSVVLTDLNGHIEYANRAFEENTGYSLNEVMGKKISLLKSGKTEVEVYRNLWVTLQSGKEWRGELINRKKNGDYYWESISISPFYDLQGAVTNYLAVKLDITERKQTEELLRVNEEKYRYMFINNPQPMWIYDLNTLEILEVNLSAINHYGYSREEFLGMTLKDIRPKEDIAALLQDIKETKNQLNSAGEWRHLKKNGEEIIVEIYSHSITYNGKPARHVMVNDITKRKRTEMEIRDVNTSLEQRIQLRTIELAKANEIMQLEIDERKKAEIEIMKARAEAERANLAKSDFLSRMSHELRTPMNSILGFAQLLDMGTPLPGQRKGIAHIINSGKHLLDLINEILDISRIEAGRLSLSIEPVQLSGIILEVLDIVQVQASASHLNLLLISSASNQLYVNSDRQRLKQILLNLVSNAIKYNRENGTVTIQTTLMPIGGNTETQFIRIAVADTGYGISQEDLPKLFTPFERIGAEKSQTEGTGLGLAVVQKLAEAMGGKNGVESEVGVGSTFWIELPLSKNQTASQKNLSDRIDGNFNLKEKSGTILYIEDNEANIELVREILTTESPNVILITEHFGSKAHLRSAKEQPDLILLDLNLPDLHGSEVLINLKGNESTMEIPVVVISADAMPSQQKRLLRLGAKNYLTKPLDVTELLKIVDTYLK